MILSGALIATGVCTMLGMSPGPGLLIGGIIIGCGTICEVISRNKRP